VRPYGLEATHQWPPLRRDWRSGDPRRGRVVPRSWQAALRAEARRLVRRARWRALDAVRVAC